MTIDAIRNCLASASTAPSLRLRALHLAVARNMFAKLTEELASARVVLEAQEAELTRTADPKQLAFGADE